MRLGHRTGFFGGEKIVYFFNNGKIPGYNWTVSNKDDASVGSTLKIDTSHVNRDDGTGHGDNDGGTDGSTIKITVDVSKYKFLYINITERIQSSRVYVKSGSTTIATLTTANLNTLDISSYSSITIQLETSRASATYPYPERGKTVTDKNSIEVSQVYVSKREL